MGTAQGPGMVAGRRRARPSSLLAFRSHLGLEAQIRCSTQRGAAPELMKAAAEEAIPEATREAVTAATAAARAELARLRVLADGSP